MLNNMKKIIQAPIIQLSAKAGILGMATFAAFNYTPKTDDKAPTDNVAKQSTIGEDRSYNVDGFSPVTFKDTLHTLSTRPSTPVNTTPALNVHIPLSSHFRKSSLFGPRHGRGHNGIDIAANTGTSITAPAYSEVAYKGWAGKYGNTVILYHGNDVYSLYAHLKKNSTRELKIGNHIQEGVVFAQVGTTGRSTGPHLHTEIIIADDTGKYGQVVNPQSVWSGANLSDPEKRAQLIKEAQDTMGRKIGTYSAVYTARIANREYDASAFDKHLDAQATTTQLTSAWKVSREMSEIPMTRHTTTTQSAFLNFKPL